MSKKVQDEDGACVMMSVLQRFDAMQGYTGANGKYLSHKIILKAYRVHFYFLIWYLNFDLCERHGLKIMQQRHIRGVNE